MTFQIPKQLNHITCSKLLQVNMLDSKKGGTVSLSVKQW